MGGGGGGGKTREKVVRLCYHGDAKELPHNMRKTCGVGTQGE